MLRREVLAVLGTALTESGRNLEAVPSLRRATKLAPNSEFAWDMFGYLCHYTGLDDIAEQAYRRSEELNPTTPRIYWMHARMLLYQGRTEEAEREMRQALAAHPGHFKVMAFLGNFLYYENKLDEAESELSRAVELGKTIALALYNGGLKHVGEEIVCAFPLKNELTRAKIVSPHFIDPEGKRLHA